MATHYRLPITVFFFVQPHVEAATVYGLRRQALLVFLPKYHLKVCRCTSIVGLPKLKGVRL